MNIEAIFNEVAAPWAKCIKASENSAGSGNAYEMEVTFETAGGLKHSLIASGKPASEGDKLLMLAEMVDAAKAWSDKRERPEEWARSMREGWPPEED